MAHGIEKQCPTFTSSTNTIGCMAHVLHLAAHDGLRLLADGPTSATTPEDEDLPAPMSIASLVTPPDGVQVNPQRQEKFVKMVKLIYDVEKPSNATTLLTHVCTRWNSTYKMLERASSLQEAYDQYCSPANMQSYWLSPIDWEKLTVMVNFLHPLYKATKIICGSTYPTINYALPLYILLIKQI
ncbi:hypothetical protein O181_101735 [Austropuccinia psidii MF-1]|uniref:HAT C-terminal dimerisation domain-containing protein n=1 Tax=Austropuccinia psidii MF-1 TaxID=1389203 RepID=A0A9Q3JF06_9BASI|nr:hypothetical protein [Austropuccinia psidii MF-1]